MMTKLVALLVYLALLIALGVGWVLNLVAVFKADFGTITGELVLRLVGIFIAPLGAFMGYFG